MQDSYIEEPPRIRQEQLYDDFLGMNQDNFSFSPQSMDRDTFKQRNDPQALLERYKLQLLNAYKIPVKETDEEGREIIRYKIKFRKNTEPLVNKQGVEDIIGYLERYINSHTVQGNIPREDKLRNDMLFISNDITMHFMAKRKQWGVSIKDIDALISTTINLVELFLSRTLFNEERKAYGESYRETTNREVKPIQKPSIFQKFAMFLSGKGKNIYG